MNELIKKYVRILGANKKRVITVGAAALIVISGINVVIMSGLRAKRPEKLNVVFSPKPERHELSPDNPREFGFLTIGQQGLELRQQDWDSSIHHLILNAKAQAGQPVDPRILRQKLETLDRLIKSGENAVRAHPKDDQARQRLMILRMQRAMLTAVK